MAGNSVYLDYQAEVGISKHLGGYRATNELLALCHADQAHEVLYAGCGIGVGPVHIARTFGVRVVGVDISPRMIEWCHVRARRARVEALTEFRVADLRELPFEPDRFDAVLAESVLAFIPEKTQALSELVRVTRLGGWVGINETFLFGESLPKLETVASRQLGVGIPTLEAWQSLWQATPLRDQAVRSYPVESASQVRSQIEWVGLGWALQAFGRLLRLSRQHPEARANLRAQFSAGSDFMSRMGYALLAGRK